MPSGWGWTDVCEFRQGDLLEPVRDVRADVVIGDVSGIPDELAAVSGWFDKVPAGGPTGSELPRKLLATLGDTLAPGGRLYLPTGTLQDEQAILVAARDIFGDNMEPVIEREFPLPDLVAKAAATARLMKEGLLSLHKRGSRLLWSLRVWRCVRHLSGLGASVTHSRPRRPSETERLLLRPSSRSDLDDLLAIYGRDDVVRFLYEPVFTEADVASASTTRWRSRSIEAEGRRVELRDGAAVRMAAFVGDCVLGGLSEQHSQGEIGFAVHPDHQGHGLSRLRRPVSSLRLAFDRLGLHRVVGDREARNIASARVMEKLGMRREAHLIENEYVKDEWQSELVYAMLHREWRSR